jgi:hypothetical protein
MDKIQAPRVVDDIPYGVYIWLDGKGRAVVDDEMNYMCIPSKKGDQRRIDRLREAARSFGINDGQAVFQAGARPVSHEEWEHQMARQQSGLVPDEYDLGNMIDEFKYAKELDKQ